MIHLTVKQSWVEKSSDSSIEEFKSALADILNGSPEDRHAQNRWVITKVSEGNTATLIYDEKPIASLLVDANGLHIESDQPVTLRQDDIVLAVRSIAEQLNFHVFSQAHNGARLPADPYLALDHTYFKNNEEFSGFFGKTKFVLRYCSTSFEKKDDKLVWVVGAPHYLEDTATGEIHIANSAMLGFLTQKENQTLSEEFSYKVADNMNDFAQKYDFGIVPRSFYTNYGKPAHIINNTDFDTFHIYRKVFIDPYVWDFDSLHDHKFYQNTKNGLHYMDKIRSGETLDKALRRMLQEELQLSGDYVGLRIWGLEFDRDKEGVLTPRLQMNVYVHGLAQKQKHQDHDWVSLK